ncbi:hypothetical protein BT96DRAFT_950564 [Gymnopus androsaceus JB14]|uniref:Uncharacterized protein n=2 Tax=Gymnopus androsaceus JB14 TaxID=1447944 RepID=A0A6A4GG47_9AGAR|nr:hypothetical protein BT96DRAFT_950564 [Gymnopus androsaceus JB14]
MAHKSRHPKPRTPTPEPENNNSDASEIEDGVCDCDGTVNHVPADDDLVWTSESNTEWKESEAEDGDMEMDQDSNTELENDNLWTPADIQSELQELLKPTLFEKITEKGSDTKWKDAGKSMRGVYTGAADHTQREHAQKLREKEAKDVKTRTSKTAQLMKAWLTSKPLRPAKHKAAPIEISSRYPSPTEPSASSSSIPIQSPLPTLLGTEIPCLGYLSDDSDNSGTLDSDIKELQEPQFHVRKPPPLKRKCSEITYRASREQQKQRCMREYELALAAITKLLNAKWRPDGVFDRGHHSQQYRRGLCIESSLKMIVNGRKLGDASQRAAEAQGFASKNGARNVAKWIAVWVKDRDLPESDRGSHAKRFSVLDDPEIKEGMAAYLQTHKWATNPAKFQEFINGSLLPRIAEKYAME